MNLILDLRLSLKYLHFGLRLRSPKTWWWKNFTELNRWSRGFRWNPHFGPIEPNVFWFTSPSPWISASIAINIGRRSYRFHPFSWHGESESRVTDHSVSKWYGPFWYYRSWIAEECK